MRKLKIGLVDLDTSHPGAWAPILHRLGHTIVGVYDGGTVYPEGYAAAFAAKYDAGKVFSSLEAMAEEADLAVIQGCDWDLHVDRAEPFVKAGKAVFVDKPIAGNAPDLLRLLEWEKQGARITGGSALRYNEERQSWLETHRAQEAFFAIAGCSVDEFNYGIHAFTLLHSFLGPGIDHVRCLGENAQYQIELIWKDNRRGIVSIGETPSYLPLYATIVTGSDVSHFRINTDKLYESMLAQVLPYLAGDAPPPIPLSELIEAELAAIAALKSRLNGGARVSLDPAQLREIRYDGESFGRFYRSQKEKAAKKEVSG